MEHCDILIIGSGAAGISAAKTVAQENVNIWLVDAKETMGGVLQQCFHHGFAHGISGPEYVNMILEDFPKDVHIFLETTVLSISEERVAKLLGPTTGLIEVSFEQVIVATGCYEIPIGALQIAGTRPSGIYNAGQMQEMMNIFGDIPEGPAVILGGGDLGLIMADQLAHLDFDVTIVEKNVRSRALNRNQRCLNKSNIQLLCNQTIDEVFGWPKLDGVRLSSGEYVPCQLLLIAIGMRPERTLVESLYRMPWVHLCGNCLIVHSMVETVVTEGKKVGLDALSQWRKDNDRSIWT